MRWATKVNITETLIEGNDTNKQRKLSALDNRDFQVGDKEYLFKVVDGVRPKLKKGEKQYYKKTGELMTEPNDTWKHVDDFNGNYYVQHYVQRIYKTLEILKTVIDIERSPKYTNKGGYKKYEENYL